MTRSSLMLRVLTFVACIAVALGWVVARLLLLGLGPATGAYRDANRLWTLGLGCLPLALTALFLARRPLHPDTQSVAAYALALAGALALPVGSYVEFYGGDARGWILFGAGLMIFAVGCLILGHMLRRAQVMPVFESRVLQSLGLLSVAGSVAGHFFVVFSLLFGFAWTWLGWRVLVSPVAQENRELRRHLRAQR
jgi:hypothetical protein